MAGEKNGAEAPADDLRSALSSAWDEAEKAEGTTEPAVAAEPAPVETAEEGTQPRDEHGRFATKQPEGPPKSAQEGEQPVKPAEAPKQPEAAKPVAEAPKAPEQQGHLSGAAPPPGWSIPAKAAYATLPDAVKQAIAQREVEVNKGLEKLAGYKGLDEYVDMARGYGTTLPEALKRYTAAERLLATDFPAAVRWLWQQYAPNLDPATVFGGNQPRQQQGNGQQPVHQRPAVDPALDQRLTALERVLQHQAATADQRMTSAINDEIERFRADPKYTYFDNVRHDMGVLIKAGRAKDMADAYEKAIWANPEIRAALISEQQQAAEQKRIKDANDAASKARNASRSITGSPDGTTAAGAPASTLREELERAYDAARV